MNRDTIEQVFNIEVFIFNSLTKYVDTDRIKKDVEYFILENFGFTIQNFKKKFSEYSGLECEVLEHKTQGRKMAWDIIVSDNIKTAMKEFNKK